MLVCAGNCTWVSGLNLLTHALPMPFFFFFFCYAEYCRLHTRGKVALTRACGRHTRAQRAAYLTNILLNFSTRSVSGYRGTRMLWHALHGGRRPVKRCANGPIDPWQHGHAGGGPNGAIGGSLSPA